jgi:DNA-binding MarR family transcriptional regulator
MITTPNDSQSYPIPMAATPTTITEVIRGPRVPKELVKSTIFLLKRLGDAVRERAVPEFVAAGCDPYHNAVLALLTEGARDTQGEIADALGYDRSHLVGILDELEADGLIERKRDPQDRRRHVVTMTDAGKEAMKHRRAVIRRIENDFLEPLDTEERKKLHDLLRKLASHHDPRFGE